MHFVKWIRKNERKIMAWVVILIMISFVGGYGLQQFLMYLGQGGSKRVVATYDDGKKIRAIDFQNAQGQLEILRSLMADRMLSILSQVNGDLGPNLLQLILFPDSGMSGELRMQLIQLAERGQLELNVDQINQFFANHSHRPEFLWILLKAEAHQAGCFIANTDAAMYLQQMVAGITRNQIDAATLIAQIVKRTKQPEINIIRTFADLISIVNYADMVLGNYTVTSDEIRGSVARNMERLTVEFLALEAESLVEEQFTPTADQIETQLKKYQSVLPGIFSDNNPYGFGYKTPKRLQVEYLLINMDDVRERIDKPTAEELESFYSRNLSRYQQSEPIDPNDPDAGTRQTIRPFAQVASQIRRDMEQQKMEDLATMILNEARQLTEIGFDSIEYETASAQTLQQAAGDYVAAAEQLRKKYEVSIYTGKTGLLRPIDMRNDLFLRRITVPTSTESTVRLMDLLLAIPADGKPSSLPGLPAIRIWENISPLSSGLLSEDNQYVPLRAMIRVTDIRQSSVPESMDFQFAINGVTLTEPEEKEMFSLQDQGVEDLRTLRAMEATQKQAEALVDLVEKEEWAAGLEQFHKTYYPQTDPNHPSSSQPRLRTLSNQPVLAQAQIEAMRRRLLNPSATTDIAANRYRNALLIRNMSDLMNPDQQSSGTIARILPFEQARQVCVVKELTRQPATEKDYRENKNRYALQLAMMSKMDLGLIHYNPDNIAKRTNLSYIETENQVETAESETEVEAE